MKSKKTIVVIIACIVLVLTFTMLVSYAYWRVTKTQTGTNTINGACLSIRLEEYYDEDENLIEGFTLDNAWPMTDNEGLNQEGYKFKVVNECEEDLTYQVILDSLDTGNNINHNFVKVSIDNGIKKYGDLTDALAEDLDYTPIASKVVYTGQIPGSTNNTVGEVEHTIKLWISEASTNDDIGKSFSSKVRVIAGQQLPHQEYALTPGECFEFDSETGTITGYDQENCTTDYLVVPQKINGVTVKNIDYLDGEELVDSETILECLDCQIAWHYIDLTKATGLEKISDFVFSFYVGTNQELIVPASVKTIGYFAFSNYNGSKLTLGNNVEEIRISAFQTYEGIDQELVIPNHVKTIGDHAFYDFNGKKLTLGSSLQTIDAAAFCSYEGDDQELVIPDSVKTIGKATFGDYHGTKLVLENGIITIGDSAFGSYVGENQKLVIPDSVKTIGNLAFSEYIGIYQELIIPNGVQIIGNDAFSFFRGTKLTLGNSINSIGKRAFAAFYGDVYINMSENGFNNVTKGSDWIGDNATLNFL